MANLRNRKVFVSHTTEDEERYAPLLAKLAEKEIDCWSTVAPGDSDSQLSPKTKDEIARRDVFLRICTQAAAKSARMQLEAWAFGATQVDDAHKGTPHQHIRIDLLMDPAYTPEPAQPAYLTINTTNRPMNDWLIVLYREIGKMQATRALSRRSITIIVVICVALGFLLMVCLLSFVILFQGATF